MIRKFWGRISQLPRPCAPMTYDSGFLPVELTGDYFLFVRLFFICLLDSANALEIIIFKSAGTNYKSNAAGFWD